MGFFDEAQEVFDKGRSAAKGAVSSVAVEKHAFVREFVRMCTDAYLQGWHERNGGNLSYRMSAEEVSSCRTFFYTTPSSWVALDVVAPEMAGEFLLVSATGVHMRNVASDVISSLGIVEIDASGASWRVMWGFKGGGMPTSELSAHVLCYAAAKRRVAQTSYAKEHVDAPDMRVMYHAHPSNAIALSCVMPLNSATVTRALWTCTSESVIAFPEGVAVLPWICPGSPELAQASARLIEEGFNLVLLAQHGVFVAGENLDEAFGRVQAIEKAAEVYMRARALCKSTELVHTLTLDNVREIAARYKLSLNEDLLD